MRIGILTHHQVESHGALLQHYALTRYLQKRGHEVFTLTYTKNMDFADKKDQQKFSVGMKSLPFYVRDYLLKKGPSFIWTMFKKHIQLQHFSKKNFSFLPYAKCDADLAIIGSDEVWSLQLGPNPMMFGHGVNAKSIISYAPSFGQTNIEEIDLRNCRALISSGISSMNAVSVRDKGSEDIVCALTGNLPQIVCDPALLYGFAEELENYRRPCKEKYVVVYGYNSNMNEPERIEAIRQYAEKYKAKVYSLGAYHKWCDKQIMCDPIEFLYWIKGAEAVFTDTFHGTIGAYLCRTPMAVYVRNTNNVKLDHLLSMLHLEERKVTVERNINAILEEDILFDELHREFETIRQDSSKWLLKMVDTSAIGDELV